MTAHSCAWKAIIFCRVLSLSNAVLGGHWTELNWPLPQCSKVSQIWKWASEIWGYFPWNVGPKTAKAYSRVVLFTFEWFYDDIATYTLRMNIVGTKRYRQTEREVFFYFSTAKVLLHSPKIWRTKWLTRTRWEAALRITSGLSPCVSLWRSRIIASNTPMLRRFNRGFVNINGKSIPEGPCFVVFCDQTK